MPSRLIYLSIVEFDEGNGGLRYGFLRSASQVLILKTLAPMATVLAVHGEVRSYPPLGSGVIGDPVFRPPEK
jgi:hypothetical protein